MDEKEFDIDYFKTKAFSRRLCKSCGAAFWTLGASEYCGEPPCVDYTFLGRSPMKKKLGINDMREDFLSFMEKHGHTRTKRYPIVARWRNDVFFVQASIYDFQPWVINGSVKPPANPLTMSQPCVRFNDIDNVGKTGRHLTLFEMMTHTAFNTAREHVYFKDRTVELCQDYLVKNLGIDEELVSYKEEEWSGGGNSGPCLSVDVQGAEIATLVFMQYREENGRKEPMPMKVVDTGYGLDRLTWVSQGTPSAYEAIFLDLLADLKDELNIETDSRILSEYSRVAGLMDAKTPGAIREIREKVARNMGLSIEELLRRILPLENLYVLLDHTRALSFMLHDGVMPSNIKSGYFARLLIRRSIRAMDNLNAKMQLSEIVERQINYWNRDFPELDEEKEDILKLVDVEQDKYKETLSRGRSLVSRMEASLRKDEGLSVGQLMELYESQGISPEQVAEFTTRKVVVPDDFYARIAEKHSSTQGATEERHYEIPASLAPTVKGYYIDQYRTEFRAKVLHCAENFVVLDETYFYPEGGGQDPDTGYIDGRRVTSVQLNGNIIVHEYEGRMFTDGQIVSCSVDRERRMNLMRHHTATHVMIAAARKSLGSHVWQAGAHKQSEISRLDITHYAQLKPEEIADIEEKVNNVIFEDRKISAEMMDRITAEGRYGFRLYQGGVVPGRDIRVVTIEGWDVEACAGTHCERTGEIGTVKILQTQRIQDGVVRIEFVAGIPAMRLYQRQATSLESVREMLNTDQEHLVETVERTIDDVRSMQKKLQEVELAAMGSTVQQLLESSPKQGNTTVVVHATDLDVKAMQSMMRMLTARNGRDVFAVLVTTGKGGQIMIGRNTKDGPSCAELLKKANTEFGGTGGGKDDFAQGVLKTVDEKKLAKFVRSHLNA